MSWGRELNKFVKKMVRSILAEEVHTHLPAQVVSYDGTIELPQIDDVPVKQFGSGKLLFSVAPQVDSYGVFHVSERNLEVWLTKGGVVDPGSSRKFNLSDGWFDPGAYPLIADGDNGLISPAINTDRIEMRTRAGTSYIYVKDDGTVELKSNNDGTVTIATNGTITGTNSGGSFELKTSGVLEVNSSVDAAALATKVDLLWATLDTVIRTAWVVAPTDGGAALKAAYIAAFATPPTSVASAKLKVDS
jgi:hypothetical protein